MHFLGAPSFTLENTHTRMHILYTYNHTWELSNTDTHILLRTSEHTYTQEEVLFIIKFILSPPTDEGYHYPPTPSCNLNHLQPD